MTKGLPRFYENVVGLETALVMAGHGPGEPRHAIFFAGAAALHVFEQLGFDPAEHGVGNEMFHRGRLDHLGFSVPNEVALAEIGDRLAAAGASDGSVTPLGPTLSVHFRDPDGFEGEINCLNPAFDPDDIEQHEVVDPEWFDRARTILTAPNAPATPQSARLLPQHDSQGNGRVRTRVLPPVAR